MSKKWMTVIISTLLLLAGTWYLYTYQPEEEFPEGTTTPNISQMILVASDMPQMTYQEITLYVSDSLTGTLTTMKRELPNDLKLVDKITQTIAYLILPDSNTRNEAIPEGTAVVSVFVTNTGSVYLNLNRHIQDRHMGGLSAELATVTSLVNTLLFNFQEIKQVQLLIEGAEIETLAGHVDCRKPFSKMLLIDS